MYCTIGNESTSTASTYTGKSTHTIKDVNDVQLWYDSLIEKLQLLAKTLLKIAKTIKNWHNDLLPRKHAWF